jgi:hypothetical protein
MIRIEKTLRTWRKLEGSLEHTVVEKINKRLARVFPCEVSKKGYGVLVSIR